MILHLVGHDYKYAVEQVMLALFPREKPSYSADPVSSSGELVLSSRLSFGNSYAQATSVMHCGDKVSRGVARVRRSKLSGKLITDRLLQRVIKQSFFRAALHHIDTPPAWGSLTGIRPASIVSAMLESSVSARTAARNLNREFYVSPERAEMCLLAALSALSLKSTLSPRDVALYVGIPFCPTRCAYCSFVSNSVEKSFGLIEPFVKTLLHEITIAAETVSLLGLRIVSIYVGGGTPTALPPEALEAVLHSLKKSFDLSFVREYTIEAGRPDTITKQKLEIISAHGAGRVCVNPQSMSRDVLSAIGRKHTPEDALDALRLAKECGAVLNVDVIAGLPADSPGGFELTLNKILEFEPENVTVHTLSLKKGSRIMLEDTLIPSGGDVAEMLGIAAKRLGGLGYKPYYLYRQKFTSGGFENTGWCLPGFEGVYNICMMEDLCSVLALGGGGVTKLVSSGRIERFFNAKYPLEYINNVSKLAEKFDSIKIKGSRLAECIAAAEREVCPVTSRVTLR